MWLCYCGIISVGGVTLSQKRNVFTALCTQEAPRIQATVQTPRRYRVCAYYKKAGCIETWHFYARTSRSFYKEYRIGCDLVKYNPCLLIYRELICDLHFKQRFC